jgi:geranylgeranyl pyrophosphate synthase
MWPDFVRALGGVLPSSEVDSQDIHKQLDWVLLPGLCCQAAGDDPNAANEIAGAWLLFYTAAHIFDCIEDQDKLDHNLANWGSGVNVNLATGMVISASSMVNGLHQINHTREFAQELGQDFFGTILSMASGQHADLITEQLDIKGWYEIAEAKSGSFFSLACRSGARLGTTNVDKIDGYSDYGLQLGIMLQILDDIEDLKSTYEPKNPCLENGIDCSLAVAYALEVLTEDDGHELLELINSKSQDINIVNKVVNILDECGVNLYLEAELDSHRNLGYSALEKADPASPAKEQLVEFLDEMRVD